MKKITLFVCGLLFSLTISAQEYKEMIAQGTHTVQEVVDTAEAYFDEVGRGRGTGYKSFRRWLYFAERDMDENGMLQSPQFYYEELQNYNAYINGQTGTAARTTVGAWEEMGPTYWNATSAWNPGVGRITSIAVDPSNDNHIIVGSQTGGVWKTVNGGQNWTVLTDNLSNLDVYSLAIDPNASNVYFWGSTGGTIFRSIDSGATWNFYSSVPGGNVNKILIDPAFATNDPSNDTKMYCSSQGSGLYKSTNSGATWTAIATGTGYDVEFKPGDTNVVYASGTNFYRSGDGGQTFTQAFGFDTGAKMIGVSADDPSVVYVLEAAGNIFGGFYKSTTEGLIFTELNHDGKNYFGYSSTAADGSGQAPRDMDIAVNPNNADEVHIAGVLTWKSSNGGSVFSITSQWVPGTAANQNIGYCHADVDIMEFAGNKLFVGTDGGIFVADDTLIVDSNYYTDLTTGMGIRQFYKIGVSQTNPVVVTGGSQDNGSSVLGADGNWTDWLGADGMESFVDKNDSQIMYGTSQFGSLYKTFNGGVNLSGISQPEGKGGQSNWNWIVPFEQHPTNPDEIFVAFDELYRSVDGGANWTSASTNYGDDIDHLKISPVNPDYMYMALNGNFFGSLDGGVNWFQSPTLNLGGARINSIAPHPTDATKVAIATTDSEKVYVSSNNGISWVSQRFDLPNFTAQAVVWQKNGANGLYVGMNYGVYYIDDNTSNSWLPFNNGLPNVRINELEINEADNHLYAATYGRGLWRTPIYSVLSVNDFELSTLSIYPNPANDIVNIKWDRSENASVRIYDVNGKLMFYSKDQNLFNGLSIDASAYNSGIYFVKINSFGGEVTKKLILK